MRVDIRDLSGMMAKSGLRDGDVIVGMNGTKFATEAATRALMSIMAKEVELMVRRGGQTLTLKAGPWERTDEDVLGGDLDRVAGD